MLTSDELRSRTTRAVQAATEAGRELGLDVHQPVVLHDAFSVVVHLSPAPVAVRVPVVLPPGLQGERLAMRQQRELNVVAWLASRGFPVVPPSSLVPPRPVARDGFSMTFWEMADVAADHVSYDAVDSSLVVELHAELRDYPAATELPFLAPVNHSVPSLLDLLAAFPDRIAPADLERARGEWQLIEPVVGSRAGFETKFPTTPLQPVHGDGPSYNVIRTTSGIRFADFEDTCLAPIEWDLALCTPDEVESYAREASRLGGPLPDPEILRIMNAARMLQMVASVALTPELPVLAEGLRPMVDAWREMPFAGGLG
jgi:hypothetical protein